MKNISVKEAIDRENHVHEKIRVLHYNMKMTLRNHAQRTHLAQNCAASASYAL